MGRPKGSKSRTPDDVFKDSPDSRKAAMDAMCFRCMGGETEPYVKLIRECSVPDCPLWNFRPYK